MGGSSGLLLMVRLYVWNALKPCFCLHFSWQHVGAVWLCLDLCSSHFHAGSRTRCHSCTWMPPACAHRVFSLHTCTSDMYDVCSGTWMASKYRSETKQKNAVHIVMGVLVRSAHSKYWPSVGLTKEAIPVHSHFPPACPTLAYALALIILLVP